MFDHSMTSMYDVQCLQSITGSTSTLHYIYHQGRKPHHYQPENSLVDMSSPPQPAGNAAAAENSSLSSLSFDNLDIVKHILLFVGKDQYRFIAAINRRFKDVYEEFSLGTKRHVRMHQRKHTPGFVGTKSSDTTLRSKQNYVTLPHCMATYQRYNIYVLSTVHGMNQHVLPRQKMVI